MLGGLEGDAVIGNDAVPVDEEAVEEGLAEIEE
jgi:hypothetical protein